MTFMELIKFSVRLASLALFLGIAACASTNEMPSETTGTAALATSVSAIPPGAIVPEANARPEHPGAAPGDYRIGVQDLLKVEVFGVPDLNRSVRVSASGHIALPLIGSVQAKGLTGEQLADRIAALLAKNYLQNPQVTIFIEEFTSQRVIVTGAVKTPNVFPLKGRTTLMQVVAAAGGPTSVANLGSVRILRTDSSGTRQLLGYDLNAIRDGQAPDPEVQGEDVVHIDSSVLKETAKEFLEFIVPFRFLAY